MYAILQHGGHQYRVGPGDRLLVNRLDAEVGSVVALEPVLFVAADDGKRGGDAASGARVAATVVSHRRGTKLRIFRYKPKKRYRRTMGYRSQLTELLVEAVVAKGEKLPKASTVVKPVADTAAADRAAPATAPEKTSAASGKAATSGAGEKTAATGGAGERTAATGGASEKTAATAGAVETAPSPEAPVGKTARAAAKPRAKAAPSGDADAGTDTAAPSPVEEEGDGS